MKRHEAMSSGYGLLPSKLLNVCFRLTLLKLKRKSSQTNPLSNIYMYHFKILHKINVVPKTGFCLYYIFTINTSLSSYPKAETVLVDGNYADERM